MQSTLAAAAPISVKRFAGTALGTLIGLIGSYFPANTLAFVLFLFLIGLVCAQFGVSTASADKIRLYGGIASSGLAALAWEDDRNGENDIYIQNVNPDCTLGIEDRLAPRRR